MRGWFWRDEIREEKNLKFKSVFVETNKLILTSNVFIFIFESIITR